MTTPEDSNTLAHIAERQPLTYLWYIRYCRTGHDAAACTAPDCFICHPIRDLVIPLPEEVSA